MKDIIILFVILAVVGASFNSCEKNEDVCSRATDLNLGLIVSNFEIGDCYSDMGLIDKQYVVRDQAAFEELGFLREGNSSCTTTPMPDIDFEQNTLLGFYGEGTCNVFFTREVTKNKSAKTYTYRLGTQECGLCERFSYSLNWVLVPKIEADYTVNFVME